MVIPGRAAICPGRVWHHRCRPAEHGFDHPVSMIWIDPDDPEELLDVHPCWSTRRLAPVRFRGTDYGTAASPFGAEPVRQDLADHLGVRPRGPVRVLTQVRRWGWLFNPITLYFAWDDPDAPPVGVVAEVTNTPWKERHRYAAALHPVGDRLAASFAKELHVSPFLEMDHTYELFVDACGGELAVSVDVLDEEGPVLRTRLEVQRLAPTRRRLGRALLTEPLPTHRVSATIHTQAARLWAKGVPIVRHEGRGRRTATSSARSVPERSSGAA